ncbi:MAG TPA: phosphatase PAP2 family protein [Thermoflexia bacterium]|jgi:membrane-associated phospholipid phosphatase|nr:phosphatase PAP2 family protein [Thermoflexia bacterium]
MQNVLDWGVEVIIWFQQFSPTLDLPFKFFTFLGEEEFFLLLLPLVYWCLDRRVGARLTVLFLFSAYLNAVAKVVAGQPRPFEYTDRVRPLTEAGGGGLPSGHTQSATVVWGYLASQFRRTWLWILAALLMILVPLSRVYLGVHFPTDLLGGYLIGAALLFLYLWAEPKGERWLEEKGLAWQLGLALGVPLLLVFLFPTTDGVTTGATMAGMGAGFVLERRWVSFDSGGAGWKRVLRYLLGVLVLFGLWMGLRIGFASLEPALLFRFVRYGLVGLWGGLGAPWVFVRLRLADRG